MARRIIARGHKCIGALIGHCGNRYQCDNQAFPVAEWSIRISLVRQEWIHDTNPANGACSHPRLREDDANFPPPAHKKRAEVITRDNAFFNADFEILGWRRASSGICF
jgi:hypothetical protein